LGFSEFAWSNPQNVISEILSYSENYTRSAGNHVGNAGTPPREHLRFQDSLVRCTEIGWAYAEHYLDDLHAWKMHIAFQEEIASLRDIQLNFVGKGILLRGAVTIGSYDIINGVAFGPAFLRALECESRLARFPRVMLEDRLAQIRPHLVAPYADWATMNLQIDEDGVTFIDYLRGAAFESHFDLCVFADSLEKHKYTLDKLCAAPIAHEGTYQKLLWSAQYHNRIVKWLYYIPYPSKVRWKTYFCTVPCKTDSAQT